MACFLSTTVCLHKNGRKFSGKEFEQGYYDYKGIRFHMMLIPPANLNAMETFEVRPDDIFLVTYPKCGTHWSTEIINLILTGGDPEKIDHTRQEAGLEMSYIKDKSNPKSFEAWHEKLVSMEGRRVIMTHLPDFLLPPQVFSKKAKVIYVTRNPKDCGVSMFHATKAMGLLKESATWNEFIDKWIKQDNLLSGGFFKHVLSYWKYRHEPNFLYMKYEDMKKDPRGSILRFADHLECPLSDEELNHVVYHSEVKNMRKTYDKADKAKFLTTSMGKSPFIRKGQIGDWKNHFTVAQNKQFDAVIQQNLHGTGLTFDFE